MGMKIYTKILCLVAVLLIYVSSSAQQPVPLKPVAAAVEAKIKSGIPAKQSAPLTAVIADEKIRAFAPQGQLARIDLEQIAQINENRDELIEITVPYNGDEVVLQLYRVNIFSDDFKVVTDQSNGEAVEYIPGAYYRGIVKGDENSLAAISFFEEEMMGVVSTEAFGQLNIGRILDRAKDEYIIYADRDALFQPESSCATIDDPAYARQMAEYMNNGAGLRTVNCVRFYFEVDNNIYINSGSTTQGATDWMTAVYNNVGTIYTNDQVNTVISEIFVWTTADPFTGSSSSARLTSFQNNRASFNGDLAQCVAIDPGGLGGVAATINGLCGSKNNKMCYSDVEYAYNNFPTYSWTIMVLTHEFGHLLGSYHTHNCSWPGGAIDNCYTPEGICSQGPAPTNGGTVMSYCHLTSYGINFSNGFGTHPGNAIRGAVDGASCLGTSCGTPSASYCASSGLNASEEWIQSITFGSFSNNSGTNAGFGDYTGQTVNMVAGTSQSFTLTPGFNGGPWSEFFSIWIDYNGDKDFTDAGENVYNSAGTTVAVSSSFTVPVGQTGTTRMRISMKYNASPTSCEVFDYGEVEDYSVTFSAAPCSESYESNNSKNGAKTIPVGTPITSQISTSTDKDWFKWTNTSSAPNMRITLTNPPADYDIKLYNTSGSYIKVSENSGTSNETITHNTSVIGTYKVQVYGWNGAFSNTQCYTLLIETSASPFSPPAELLASGSEKGMKLYPNPVADQLTVELVSPSKGQARVNAYNLMGQRMVSLVQEVAEGTNFIQLDVSDYARGTYFFEVILEEEVLRKEFIVTR
jgi:hypothetical protein